MSSWGSAMTQIPPQRLPNPRGDYEFLNTWPASSCPQILDRQPEPPGDIPQVPGRRVTTSLSPVVTSLDLSSSSPTSSSSTLRPGKKKPIILWKNWWVS